MKLSIPALLAMALSPFALAAPVPDQSPNPDLVTRQVTLWVWACDGANFSSGCAAVKTVNLNQCYSWASLFPGIGNGSFKTNANVFFWDGGSCTGTASNRVCDVEISRGDYWYDHTQSINIFSTMAACPN